MELRWRDCVVIYFSLGLLGLCIAVSDTRTFSDEALWRSACARVCREEEVIGLGPVCLLNDSSCKRACEIPCNMEKYVGIFDCRNTCKVQARVMNFTRLDKCLESCGLTSKFFFHPLRPYWEYKNITLPEFDIYIGSDISKPNMKCNSDGVVVSPSPSPSDRYQMCTCPRSFPPDLSSSDFLYTPDNKSCLTITEKQHLTLQLRWNGPSHRRYEVIVTENVISENSTEPLYRCKIVKEPKLDIDDIDNIFTWRQLNEGLAVSIIDAEPRYLIRLPQYIVRANGKASLYVEQKLGLAPSESSTATVEITTETTTQVKTTETPAITSKVHLSTTNLLTEATSNNNINSSSPPKEGGLSKVTLAVALAAIVTFGVLVVVYVVYKCRRKKLSTMEKSHDIITNLPPKLANNDLPQKTIPSTVDECQNKKCMEQFKLLEERIDEAVKRVNHDPPVHPSRTTIYIATARMCPIVKNLIESLKVMECDCAVPAMEERQVFEVGDGPWTCQRLASSSKIIFIVTQELLNCVSLFDKTLRNIGDFAGSFSNSELRMICEWKFALSLEYNYPTQNRIILAALDDTSGDTIKNVLALQSKTVLRLPDDRVKILSLVVGIPESDCHINITVQKPAFERRPEIPDDIVDDGPSCSECSYQTDHDDDYDDDYDDDDEDDDNFTIIINEKSKPFGRDPDMSLPTENIERTMIRNDCVESYSYA